MQLSYVGSHMDWLACKHHLAFSVLYDTTEGKVKWHNVARKLAAFLSRSV